MTGRLSAPAVPAGVSRTTEHRLDLPVPLYTHDAWQTHADWLSHGVTGRDADMSLFGSAAVGAVLPRWAALRQALGCTTIVHARQVHRGAVLHHDPLPEGIFIAGDADGHLTRAPATLLTVSVADCVPVSIVAPEVRAIALVHAGWRGVAANIVENALDLLRVRCSAHVKELLVHCGPAICGDCYEVGPEVPEQLGVQGAPTHVDVRAVIADRVIRQGVPVTNVSLSTHCTRCGDAPFFSHRGGCAERQIAVLGIRQRA